MGESTSTYFLEFIKCRGTVHFSQPSADLLLSAYQYMHCVFSCNEHVSAIIQRNEFTQLLLQNLQSVPPAKNGIFMKNRTFLISMTHVLASQDGPDSWDICHLSGRIHFL